MDFSGGLGNAGDAEEVIRDCCAREQGCDRETAQRKQNEDADVSHMRNALLRRGDGTSEALEEQIGLALRQAAEWAVGQNGFLGLNQDGLLRDGKGTQVFRRGFVVGRDKGSGEFLGKIAHEATGFFLRVVFVGFPFLGVDALVSEVRSVALRVLLIEALLEATAGPATPCAALRLLRMTDFLFADALLFFPGLKPSVACAAFSVA